MIFYDGIRNCSVITDITQKKALCHVRKLNRKSMESAKFAFWLCHKPGIICSDVHKTDPCKWIWAKEKSGMQLFIHSGG